VGEVEECIGVPAETIALRADAAIAHAKCRKAGPNRAFRGEKSLACGEAVTIVHSGIMVNAIESP